MFVCLVMFVVFLFYIQCQDITVAYLDFFPGGAKHPQISEIL